MTKILLKNVKLVKNSDVLLSNINLELSANDNIVIVPEQNEDIRSVQALIRIIAGIYQVNNGTINFENVNKERVLLGYKNLEHLFNREISINELIKTLIKTQNLTKENLSEIKELMTMFQLNDESLINKLEYQQKNLLNLLTLLIIKPTFLIIDQLSFPGSAMMQLTILEYIKQYCHRYKISLIISSDDDDVIDTVANRVIILNKTKIVNDLVLNKINNQKSNDVDNKTKAYDLQDDILAALNQNNSFEQTHDEVVSKYEIHETTNKKNYYNNIVEEAKPIEEELIYEVTKALDNSFEDEIITSIKATDEMLVDHDTKIQEFKNTTVTNDLLTVRYETDLDEDILFANNKKIYEDKIHHEEDTKELCNTPLNQKFTGSLEFEKEEIKQKTKKLNEDSKDVLEDIKISQNKHFSTNVNRYLSDKEDDDNNGLEDEYMTKEFLSEIKETYAMRKALSEQIKSPDFAKLTPELQQKVYQNHDAADKLIKEIDPEGKYDPSKIHSYTTKKIVANSHNTRNLNTVTKAMIEETVYENDEDIDGDDDTDEFDTTEMQSDELTNDDFIDDDEISKPFISSKPKTVSRDLHHYDNDRKFKNKKSNWRDRFVKKERDDDLYREVYGQNPDNVRTRNYLNNNYQPTNNINRQNNYNNHHQQRDHRYNNYQNNYHNNNHNNNHQWTSNYEPTRKHYYQTKTNVILPSNKQYKTNYFNAEPNEPKRLKTMAIKQRSKKNLIEKLYDEAMEDRQIINEFKDKKSK